MKDKITVWILHAGIGHKSPYFSNLIETWQADKNYNLIVDPNFPQGIAPKNGFIYFNRLKRFYSSDNIQSIHEFLNNIEKLKRNGWKIIFTLHNFMPIDRNTNDNDIYLMEKFLDFADIVFTLSKSMQQSLLTNFNIKAVCHGIGRNILKDTNSKITLPKFSKDSVVFSFVGNISEYKMINEIIDAFMSLKNENCYLIIAGPENQTYKPKIPKSSRIIYLNTFIGQKDWSKISKVTTAFLNTYDVNRNCFKYGFFPSNCVEISFRKKFCIVPNCSEIKELLPSGYYCSYNKPEDLKNALLYVINNREKILSLEKTYPLYDHDWIKTVKIIKTHIESYSHD